MIPAAFDYARATSIDDALEALSAGDGTKLVAGGHSLIPLLRFRLAAPPRLLDISQIDELRGIRHEGGKVRIGAATTYRELLESDALVQSHPLIGEATRHIGDLQVRNRGTVGGGLVHADPASDMPAVMLALDAEFALRSRKDERSVSARDFFVGPFTTAMKEDELLAAIDLPELPDGTGSAYVTFEQAASGYALVGAAAVITKVDGNVERADLAFTGISGTPFLAAAAQQLVGTEADEETCDRVAREALDGIEPNEDIHAPAEYRRHLATVAARRALLAAASRAS